MVVVSVLGSALGVDGEVIEREPRLRVALRQLQPVLPRLLRPPAVGEDLVHVPPAAFTRDASQPRPFLEQRHEEHLSVVGVQQPGHHAERYVVDVVREVPQDGQRARRGAESYLRFLLRELVTGAGVQELLRGLSFAFRA